MQLTIWSHWVVVKDRWKEHDIVLEDSLGLPDGGYIEGAIWGAIQEIQDPFSLFSIQQKYWLILLNSYMQKMFFYSSYVSIALKSPKKQENLDLKAYNFIKICVSVL